jgi:hypothetical protein
MNIKANEVYKIMKNASKEHGHSNVCTLPLFIMYQPSIIHLHSEGFVKLFFSYVNLTFGAWEM